VPGELGVVNLVAAVIRSQDEVGVAEKTSIEEGGLVDDIRPAFEGNGCLRRNLLYLGRFSGLAISTTSRVAFRSASTRNS